MSVPMTRRALQFMRKLWKDHSVDKPIDLTVGIPHTGRSLEQFAMQFTLGVHRGTR
jgi:hypothetical protein